MTWYHLFWIIPLTLIVGATIGVGLTGWYLANKIRKELGFKSIKEFVKHVKKSQELQKKMEKGDLGNVMEAINRDPHLKKQMEELRRRFSQE